MPSSGQKNSAMTGISIRVIDPLIPACGRCGRTINCGDSVCLRSVQRIQLAKNASKQSGLIAIF